MSLQHRPAIHVLVCIVAFAALSACGGGDGDGAAASAAPAATTVAQARISVVAPASAPSLVTAPGDLAELRLRVTKLEEAVLLLGQSLDRLAAAGLQRPGRAPATSRPSDAAAIDASFRAEPMDPGWSAQAAAALRAALGADSALADHINQIECRSLRCRVEVAAEGVEFIAPTLSVLTPRLLGVVSRAATVQVVGLDGRPSTLVFFSR